MYYDFHSRKVKIAYNGTPEGTRSIGRLRLKWMDNVRMGLEKFRIRN